MLSDEEKQAIKYLKSRLYGNEGCKFIDVAQSDLRIFLKLVENLQKDIESWKKYCDEQENDIILKNNKVCDLEFKIEKQSKEIEELKEECKEVVCVPEGTCFMIEPKDIDKKWEDKIKAKIEEQEKIINTGGIDFNTKSYARCKKEFGQSLLEKE